MVRIWLSSIIDWPNSVADQRPSSSSSMALWWLFVWSNQLPSKLKIFLWRLCIDGIPFWLILPSGRCIPLLCVKIFLLSNETTLQFGLVILCALCGTLAISL
ncbi:hypothetical protein ACOSQ3_017464 [Xanthoceras sorbifolium]